MQRTKNIRTNKTFEGDPLVLNLELVLHAGIINGVSRCPNLKKISRKSELISSLMENDDCFLGGIHCSVNMIILLCSTMLSDMYLCVCLCVLFVGVGGGGV